VKLVKIEAYESPVRKFNNYYCGAKDTSDARRCEGYEYANQGNNKISCKHCSWLTGLCERHYAQPTQKKGR